MEIPLLKDIAVIFGLAVIVLWLCNRLKIPAIVGFLFTGIISGPHGLKLIHAASDVETLSEIGIMLLLFTIGLEFSLTRLMSIKRYFFIGGGLQTIFTVLAGFLIAKLGGRPVGEAIFLGFLLTMSSTAIVLKSFEAKDETDSPHGNLSLGILIFQDIIAVPMMLLTPMLGSAQEGLDTALLMQLAVGFVVIILVFLAATKIIPTILYQIAKTRSRELFSLSVLTICFGVAWFASSIGLSLAIGAFLAGLIISESDYRHEAIGNIMPLQDIFSSLFFVSIGMLLDVRFVLEQPFMILFITIGVLLLKASIIAATAFCLRLPIRVMILAGIALCQVGEFSFVLARAGMASGIATEYLFQLFLSVALLTMAVSPSLLQNSGRILRLLMKLPISDKWKLALSHIPSQPAHKYSEHIVIIGYGVSGRSLAHAAKESNLPYAVLEINPETVRSEKANGVPIYFGDATHEAVLHNLHTHDAKVIAIMINDIPAARRAVLLARQLNPEAYIIVRVRYLIDVQMMRKLGANDVIPDELGTSVEMFMRVLNHYKVDRDQIDKLTDQAWTEDYKKITARFAT